jgi:hypothetical protein
MQLGCAATHRESQPQSLMGVVGLIEPSLNLSRAEPHKRSNKRSEAFVG